MNEEPHIHPTDVTGFLSALRRRWMLVVVCWVALVSGATYVTLTQQKQYEASADLLFRDPGLDQKVFGTTFVAPGGDPTREAATNVGLVSLDVVAQRTARKLGGLTTEQVAAKVAAEPEGASDLVSVTATDPDPALAQRLANAFAEEYIDIRREADRSKIVEAERLIQTRLAEMSSKDRKKQEGRELKVRRDQLDILASLQTGNAEIVQPAQKPTSPSAPRVKRNIALAVVLGLLFGVGLALLLERLDRRIRDPDELAEALGVPVLGLVPHSAALTGGAVGAEPGEAGLQRGEAEAFRMLRARMRYFNVDRQIRTVLVSSASAGDGKTTVALHLAAAAATSGARVLLLEADLRRPTLAMRIGVPQGIGLSEVLTHAASVEKAVRHVSAGTDVRDAARTPPGFDVITAGFVPPNPSELLESQQMQEFLEQLASSYDLVVIDTPPLLVVADAIPLIRRVDGVLIVSRLGATTRDAARHLRVQMEGLDAPVLGVVANGLRGGASGYYYGYYGRESPEAPDGASSTVATEAESPPPKVGR